MEEIASRVLKKGGFVVDQTEAAMLLTIEV